jgi:hypothetical protein
MRQQSTILAALSALALLAAGAVAAAEEQGKPAAQNAQAAQRSDQEVAVQYGNEAAELRAKAQSHRSLANNYRARSGKTSYAQIAGHCDKLAKFYEDAAKEAEAIASGLSK